jgi:thiol-disulfide isomerase/thioredoxin
MSTFRMFPLVLGLVALAGCESGDSDEDGIPDDEEAALGLDPNVADSDGDGIDDGAELDGGSDPALADTDGDTLMDGDELELGTDPANIDTDGDTYRDGDEVLEETDPLDPASRIYTGYWPYYAGKEDLLQNPVEGETFKLNKQFARVKAVDQYGEVLDLYDFYNLDGKPVMFDVSAEWCGPCNELAAFLDGDDTMFGYEVDPGFIELRKRINQGEVYWLTVLSESWDYSTADVGTCERWFDDYPKDQIPVLADEAWDYENTGDSITEYVDLGGWPTVILMDGELKPKTSSDASYIDALCEACEMLGIETVPELGWCV